MSTQDSIKENQEFDKVVSILTPQFKRTCDFSYAKPRKRLVNKIWAISGIAAMFVVVLSVAIKSVLPASATEVVKSAFGTLTDAECVKVEFVWRGEKASAEEIYTPTPSGNMINGTLCLLRKNGKVNVRIDWHDAEKNSIIFNGCEYIHLMDSKTVDKHSSSFGEELMNLFNENSLPYDLKNKAALTDDGNRVIMKCHKGDITLCGEFLRDTRQLVKASVWFSKPDGGTETILETQSIQTNINIPESLFSE